MRHIRRKVDEITGGHFRYKVELLTPAYLATALHDVDSDFVAAVMMSTSLRVRLESDCADPGFSSPAAGEIKGGCTPRSRRSPHGPI
jgi:hypothetical protein